MFKCCILSTQGITGSDAECYSLSYPTATLAFSWYTVPTNEAVTTESQRHNCFIRNTGNAIPNNVPVKGLKLANPLLGLTQLWARNPSRGILTAGKFHNMKPDKHLFYMMQQRVIVPKNRLKQTVFILEISGTLQGFEV
jgi:hypothetical protein